jgi:hypothetical protein
MPTTDVDGALRTCHPEDHDHMTASSTPLYDDGRIACDDDGLIVRWYYLWGTKRIPYRAIRSVRERPLSFWRGKWRLWGSSDFGHWFNLDGSRPKKETALEIDTGQRVRAVITPDDPEAVLRIVEDHRAA